MQLDPLPLASSPASLDRRASSERDPDADLDALLSDEALLTSHRDEDPLAIARAIRADAEPPRAPAMDANTNADPEPLTATSAIVTALGKGYDRLADVRVHANDRVAVLAGDLAEDGVDVGILQGALEAVFGTVTSELMQAVTAKLGPALLGKIILSGFDKVLALVSEAAVGAATRAMRDKPSDETDRALFFLGVERGVRDEAYHAGMGALEAIADGREELPTSVGEVHARFEALAAEAERVQDRVSRSQWLTYRAQSRLGRMEHDTGVATRDGATGGTALALESSRDTPGVLQVVVKPDLRTIERAWLPGAGAVQGPQMQTLPLAELGIPVRYQIGDLKQVILVNETGRANALGTALRQVLCVLGGGPGHASADFLWGAGRAFVERGLAKAVTDLGRQRLGSRLAQP